jgi:hypothetical protein
MYRKYRKLYKTFLKGKKVLYTKVCNGLRPSHTLSRFFARFPRTKISRAPVGEYATTCTQSRRLCHPLFQRTLIYTESTSWRILYDTVRCAVSWSDNNGMASGTAHGAVSYCACEIIDQRSAFATAPFGYPMNGPVNRTWPKRTDNGRFGIP